ncbi:MAG TPA: homoserine O-acetyltransferase [Nocardioidaceae bacterium]|nr:homoserine O-acetyltransferase [Nocardioidaceae bacterium]
MTPRPGLGLVSTQRVGLHTEADPLLLASGERLGPVDVAYETYGVLSAARDNVVVVCHALTGDAHAAGHHGDPLRPGWWDNLIGPGRAVDTERFFVVCANLLGGCQGTTGPLAVDPRTGAPYGLGFPLLAMSDLVAVHRGLLAHLGVERVHAAVGGSLGGMQILQWALDAPDQIDRAVLVGASSRLTAENIAFSTVARTAILRDPDFADGRYPGTGRRPEVGLSVARMLAHITYLSEQSLEDKFGRRRRDEGPPRLGTHFEVESYLDHQAAVFLARFDALSYLYLTRVMDYFDPFASADAAARIAAGTARFLVLSFDSDWRFPTFHSRRIHEHLSAAGVPSVQEELHSPWGHDSFLLEPPGYHDRIRAFLD